MARPTRVVTIADTGAIYALIDSSDGWHDRVLKWWSSVRTRIVVPSPVVPEVCYLLGKRISANAELAFVQSAQEGEFHVVHPSFEDEARALELMASFITLPLGYVDAIVMAMAESLEARHVLTTDRRHFSTAPGKRKWTVAP